jgi:CRISPR/Cas system CSM-associated protein Csm2 small subunit
MYINRPGGMMQTNVTVRAEDTLIARAKGRAQKENKTLDGLFNEWLHQYTENPDTNYAKEFNDFMDRVQYANSGRAFSREEMNAR